MRALVLARWPPIVATAATLCYAVIVAGFGLDYRPLHNDEGVTLQVAQNGSARGVLDIAVNYRHGPPLHYLLVHLSMLWHDDVLGLRLPSALLGIASVALAYWFGRELLGRPGGAIVSVIVAASPAVVHLGQFSRGYTAMLAASFLSLWLLLVLLRTRRLRFVAPYVLSALMLAASHPFGLLALLSELVLLVVLGLVPLARDWRANRRALLALSCALAAAAVVLVALRHVYAPLQSKYHVGHGGAVIDPVSTRFWSPLGEAWSGSARPLVWIVLAAVVVAGVAVLWNRDRRAALVCTVWLATPLLLLMLLTADSADFAPERHLSFLIPAYATALAAAALEVGRRAGRRGPLATAAVLVVLLLPGAVAIANDVGNFTADLRDAGLFMAGSFGRDDVLLTSAGGSEPGVASRLYGAYAVLEAPSGSALKGWRHLGDATGCKLLARLGQRPAPAAVWVLLRPPDPDLVVVRLAALGADPVRRYGDFVVARVPVKNRNEAGALRRGVRIYRSVARLSGPVRDFGTVAADYRLALAFQRAGVCA